jgi:hypothetical protein
LNLRESQIGKRPRFGFLIVSEITYQGIRIGITRIAKHIGVVAVIARKVKNSGPLTARCLAIL